MNKTEILNSEVPNEKIVCPNCHNELKNIIKENIFYKYYKCAQCGKVYRLKQQLHKDDVNFLIGENISKIKTTLYCILGVLILWFLIYISLIQRFLYFGI